MKSGRILSIIGGLLLFSACATTTEIGGRKKAQNIILLIGDGMGLTQVSSLYYFQEATPQFNRFKVVGLHQNQPTSHKITDSAAGATAFSAGVKSYNGAIGVDEDSVSQETILEMAIKKGLSTGVVATSSITHATPASFYAHVPSRQMHEEIAQDLLASSVDFFAGGGLKFFNKRSDGQNLLKSLEEKNYVIDTSRISATTLISGSKRYGYLLAADGMPKMQEGRGDFLPNATALALDRLQQNNKGFFLMVEGSQIDWGGHANDGAYIIEEMKDFDKTLKVALDFAEREGNTLVVVTADHETGGFSLSPAQVRKQDDYRGIQPTFSTGGHSASLIPVFAYGPGAREFMGIYQNSEIFQKMLNASKW